jgi:hypothetical protein
MTVGVEVGGKRAKRLNGGHRARPDIFAMEKLLEAFEDALIGGLREKGKKVYEIDPLLCRFCGTEMKIVSFITEYLVIKKIFTHIHYESQPPQPLAHSPPLFRDTVYVPF